MYKNAGSIWAQGKVGVRFSVRFLKNENQYRENTIRIYRMCPSFQGGPVLGYRFLPGKWHFAERQFSEMHFI
jgi:hypothetical protein